MTTQNQADEDCETKTVCQVFGCGGCGKAPDLDDDLELEEEDD